MSKQKRKKKKKKKRKEKERKKVRKKEKKERKKERKKGNSNTNNIINHKRDVSSQLEGVLLRWKTTQEFKDMIDGRTSMEKVDKVDKITFHIN